MTGAAEKILIVRHGPGRGRLSNYLQWALDDIAKRWPRLSERFRFHYTGEAAPDLSGVGAVVFWLGDPLRERYPDCYVESARIRDAARAHGVRIINDPDALSNTIKSVQAHRWHAAGVPTPAHYPFATRNQLEDALGIATFPAILRADRLHALEGMHVCATPGDVLALPDETIRYPGAIAEFIDVRSGYETSNPGTVWSQLFHKKRQYVFGHVTRTSHLFFSPEPLVSSSTCTFRLAPEHVSRWQRGVARLTKRLPQANARRWKAILAKNPASQREFDLLQDALREDLQYWEAGSEQTDVMTAAMTALGLDFAAIDYSSLADGSVVLWEANPHFNLPPARQRMLPKERRTLERLTSYGDAVAEFLGSLLGDAAWRPARA
jgi:hypothetical protein